MRASSWAVPEVMPRPCLVQGCCLLPVLHLHDHALGTAVREALTRSSLPPRTVCSVSCVVALEQAQVPEAQSHWRSRDSNRDQGRLHSD